MRPEDQYLTLVDALCLLAGSADEQEAWLPEFVVVEDEVLTTYGDAHLLVPQLVRAGLVPQRAAPALEDLDALLEEIARGSGDRAEDQRRTEPWARARRLAAAALASLDEEPRPPSFSLTTWVKSGAPSDVGQESRPKAPRSTLIVKVGYPGVVAITFLFQLFVGSTPRESLRSMTLGPFEMLGAEALVLVVIALVGAALSRMLLPGLLGLGAVLAWCVNAFLAAALG